MADDGAALWDYRRAVAELYAEVRAYTLEEGPAAAWHHWRRTRDRLFRTHPQSPIPAERRAGLDGLPYFDYDPAFRFLVPLAPVAAGASPLHHDLGADDTVVLRPFARTAGLAEALGAELTLYWIEGYGGGVFLPFRDAGGRDGRTYGGGRYLLDTIKGADLGRAADGRAVLDLNFAYNPSCAHDPRWACPLAPPANSLPAAVAAGEKAPPGLQALS